MRFSLKAILLCMLIAALAAVAVSQQQRNERLPAQTAKLRQVVEANRAEAREAVIKSQVCQKLLAEARFPSAVFQASLERFQTVQEKYGSLDRNVDLPTLKRVPSIRDDHVDRHLVRVFVPPGAEVGVRVAVVPRREPPFRGQSDADILFESPFRPSDPLTIPLSRGEHLVQTTWTPADRTFELQIDGERRHTSTYANELKSQYKYRALGSHVNNGSLRKDRKTLGIRSVTPVDREQGLKYTIRCDLVRLDDRGADE